MFSEKYTCWGAVFPGIEASSFTLQCKIGQPFGEFTTIRTH